MSHLANQYDLLLSKCRIQHDFREKPGSFGMKWSCYRRTKSGTNISHLGAGKCKLKLCFPILQEFHQVLHSTHLNNVKTEIFPKLRINIENVSDHQTVLYHVGFLLSYITAFSQTSLTHHPTCHRFHAKRKARATVAVKTLKILLFAAVFFCHQKSQRDTKRVGPMPFSYTVYNYSVYTQY